MAKVKREDLEHLSSDEIRRIILDPQVSKELPEKVYNYILEDGNIYEHTHRRNRVGSLLERIIISRFLKNKL